MYCNERSFKGKVWQVPAEVAPDAEVEKLPKDLLALLDQRWKTDRLPEELIAILKRRGLTKASEIFSYLLPTLKEFMPDPYRLVDMQRACERFVQAVEAGERIAVYGDYDVDGATSSSIVVRFMKLIGHQNFTFYIPDRLNEGYGPNANAMRTLREDGASLVVIVDSGIAAVDKINEDGSVTPGPLTVANSIGLETIVLDHHEPADDGRMPPGIVVDPKRLDETREFDYLCAAGLAFLFVVGCRRLMRDRGLFSEARPEPSLMALLGIACLGTVADVVPLIGLNRVYVREGLNFMEQIPGLVALTEELVRAGAIKPEHQFYSAYHCGFKHGPCINAGGRISDTMTGTRLLTSDDLNECREWAAKLVSLNEERKEMEKRMVTEAKQMVEAEFKDDAVLVLHNDDWHPGVVGLVASRIKDAYDKPCFAIGNKGKGSARAVDGFDVGHPIRHAKDDLHLLKSGGGHAAAGGIGIAVERIPEFRAYMNEIAKDFVHPPLKVDLAFRPGQIGLQDLEMIEELMAPFGMGNSRPRVVVYGGILGKARIMAGKHIKTFVENDDDWNKTEIFLSHGVDTPLGDALIGAEGHFVDVYGVVKIDRWGSPRIQLDPSDIMIGALARAEDDDMDVAEY
jgi:single-stranded-DNA-specific exonuclease